MDKNIVLAAIGLGAMLLLSSKGNATDQQSGASEGTTSFLDTGFADITPRNADSGITQPSITYNLTAPVFPAINIPSPVSSSSFPSVPSDLLTGQSIDPTISKKQATISPYYTTQQIYTAPIGPRIPTADNPSVFLGGQSKKAATVQNPYTNPQSVDLKSIYKVK